LIHGLVACSSATLIAPLKALIGVFVYFVFDFGGSNSWQVEA